MFCSNCGKQISPSDAFCSNCGTAVKTPQIPSSEVTQEQSRSGTTLNKFSWSTVFLFAGIAGIAGLIFGHAPPELNDTANTVSYKVVGFFVWGFIGLIIGAIYARHKQ